MALARFNHSKPGSIPISRKFGAPKKVEQMSAWFKAARKVIPEIPNPEQTDWQITCEHATSDAKFITFELANSVGDRCSVIIDRSISLIG